MVRVKQRTALFLTLLACSAGFACGGGDPATVASGAASEEYFPLVEGATWTYALGGMLVGEVEVVARGLRPVRGLEDPVFIMDEVSEAGRAVGIADVAPVGYVRVEQYLGRYLGLDYVEEEIRLLGGEDPVRFLPVDPVSVTQWEEENRIFELPDGGGGVRRWAYAVRGVPSLEVPAGTFRDVIVVESQYWDEAVSEGPVLRFEDYYGRGVGLLRTVTYDEQNEGRISVEQNLLRYAFPVSPDA